MGNRDQEKREDGASSFAQEERNHPYRIALRPDGNGMTDDVVVNDVSMFRAEMMSNRSLWMCCYLAGTDERIDFWVSTTSRGGLRFFTTDVPRIDGLVYENDRDADRCLEWKP